MDDKYLRATKTRKALHGEDTYIKAGRRGGQAKNPNKGFGSLTEEQKIEFYKNRTKKMKEKRRVGN